MNDEELINFDERYYVNPQTGLNESNAFIDNLRQAQAEDTARINQQTYALGTQVPANLGGLAGAEATFAERYQVPQTEQMIANLKSTAQTQALNQALENTLAQYKNQYKQAYRNAYAKAMTPTSANSASSANLANNGNVEYVEPEGGEATGSLSGVAGKYTVVDAAGNIHIVDMETGQTETAPTGITYGNIPDSVAVTAVHGIGTIGDVFTGKYRYRLPDGRTVELGGHNEKLKLGSDGRYYIWNTDDNTYRVVE